MTTGDIRFPRLGEFDPRKYPHGIVCGWCNAPLTEKNVATRDVTDPEHTSPWDLAPEDGPRVLLYSCIDCVISGAIYTDPEAQKEDDG